jgi:hypothetical protein
MTVNSSRSMVRSLEDGSCDGKYKKFERNREPIARDAALERLERSQLSERFYDIEQASTMITPDGKIIHR